MRKYFLVAINLLFIILFGCKSQELNGNKDFEFEVTKENVSKFNTVAWQVDGVINNKIPWYQPVNAQIDPTKATVAFSHFSEDKKKKFAELLDRIEKQRDLILEKANKGDSVKIERAELTQLYVKLNNFKAGIVTKAVQIQSFKVRVRFYNDNTQKKSCEAGYFLRYIPKVFYLKKGKEKYIYNHPEVSTKKMIEIELRAGDWVLQCVDKNGKIVGKPRAVSIFKEEKIDIYIGK